MTKEELALEVIDRLKKEYPLADCTLDYDEAWKLLVSVRLAAQCTDARVNVVVQDLYARYPDVAALAAATPEEIEAIVKPCGLGKSKARDISACMKILHEKYHDNVPCDFDALLALPGVGRKSANLIMGDVFGKPAIVTDTHCIRLTNRIGLVDGIKDPKKVEMALWKIIPPEEGNDFCHRLVKRSRLKQRLSAGYAGFKAPYKKEAFSPGYFLENASFYGYSPTLLLNANIKIFSNPTLTAIMTIVHANRSGVSRYTLALYNFSPMEPAGMPITSAAIPAFQQRPSPSLQAVTAYGITWER